MFKIKDNYIYRQCVNDSRLIDKLSENNLEIFFDSKVFKEMLLVANPQFFHNLTKEKYIQIPPLETMQKINYKSNAIWII